VSNLGSSNTPSKPEPLQLGPHRFEWGSRTYVMGVLNVTPDSFSGDGVWPDRAAALRLAERHVADGADLLDIGGESTRPGAAPVPVEEELRRVVPLMEALASRLSIPISVDTTKAAVARAAVAAGAQIVNDISGLRHDPQMARVIATSGAAAVLMENGRGLSYIDLLPDILTRLRQSVTLATRAGVPRERLIIDPGLGFGKRAAQSLEVIQRLGELRALGLPLLVGPSRKATIGRVLGLPVEERLEGTAAMVAVAIANGADIIRVHDVRAMARVARMTDAILRGWSG
jgi:dihydropteroate synthase